MSTVGSVLGFVSCRWRGGGWARTMRAAIRLEGCGAGEGEEKSSPTLLSAPDLARNAQLKFQDRGRRKPGCLRGKNFVEARGCWAEVGSAGPVNETACGRHGHRQHTQRLELARRRRPPVTQGRAKPDHSTPDPTKKRVRVGVARGSDSRPAAIPGLHPPTRDDSSGRAIQFLDAPSRVPGRLIVLGDDRGSGQ